MSLRLGRFEYIDLLFKCKYWKIDLLYLKLQGVIKIAAKFLKYCHLTTAGDIKKRTNDFDFDRRPLLPQKIIES